MVGSLLYSLVRVLLDVIATSHGDQGKLRAEVLALAARFKFSSARSSACAGAQATGWFSLRRARSSRDPLGRVYWSSRRRSWAGIEHWCAGSGRVIGADRGGGDLDLARRAAS